MQPNFVVCTVVFVPITLLARLYEEQNVYGELSYSPMRRRRHPRPHQDADLKILCSKTLSLLLLDRNISNSK